VASLATACLSSTAPGGATVTPAGTGVRAIALPSNDYDLSVSGGRVWLSSAATGPEACGGRWCKRPREYLMEGPQSSSGGPYSYLLRLAL
jgi:hypothetical protein